MTCSGCGGDLASDVRFCPSCGARVQADTVDVLKRLVRDAVVTEPVAPLTVKGKARPLEAFRLVEVLDVEDGRVRRTDARLVGRARERRLLDEALERVVADSR